MLSSPFARSCWVLTYPQQALGCFGQAEGPLKAVFDTALLRLPALAADLQTWVGPGAELSCSSCKVRYDQDTFDHDKGQKSAISGRRLHWRLSTGFFAFSPGSLCNLVRRAP